MFKFQQCCYSIESKTVKYKLLIEGYINFVK